MSLLHLNDKTFKKEVLESKEPVLVDFYADWCGPCKMVAPIVEELANDYKGRLKVVKLNVDEAASIASQYAVMSIPTLMIFKSGSVAWQMVGAASKKQIKEKIEQNL